MIPAELTAVDQWVLWRYEIRDGKPTKVPCMMDGRHASSMDPATWLTFAAARTSYQRDTKSWEGLGFVFTADDPYCGVDLDNCIDDEGAIKPWAVPILHQFEDTYGEISPSHKGIKIFTRAVLSGKGRRKEFGDHAIEVYDRGRFFTVTNNTVNGCPSTIAAHQTEIDELYKLAAGTSNGASRNGSAPKSEGKIPQGQRHNAMLSLAGTMRKRGMGVEAIYAALWATNVERCEPPYDAAHVRKIASDAGQWDAGDTGPAADILHQPYTDFGNAERLVLLHGADIRYCHPWQKWLIYDGRRWLIDASAEILRRAKDTIRRFHIAAANIPDDALRQTTQGFARSTEKHPRVAAMIALATAELGVPVQPEQLDADLWLLNVANGTVDLRTGELRPHDPADLITKICPVHYDPHASCDVWLEFQRQIMAGNAEMIAFKQRVIGGALTGAVLEKRSLFIYTGKQNNGKTTEVEVVRDMLGDYAGQVRIEVLMLQKNHSNSSAPSPDIADLAGKRFCVSSEPAKDRHLDEALVKYLTGMGTIKARHLHKENFEFKQTWKFFLDCNDRPQIRAADPAIWNRIGVIPFTVVIPDEDIDTDLPRKLRCELPGILAWCVRGCLEWQKTGLGVPVSVHNATAEYRSEMDVIGRFVKERCIEIPTASVRAFLLYSTYQKWGVDSGEKEILSMTAFGKEIGLRFSKVEDNKGTRYDGIGLKVVDSGG